MYLTVKFDNTKYTHIVRYLLILFYQSILDLKEYVLGTGLYFSIPPFPPVFSTDRDAEIYIFGYSFVTCLSQISGCVLFI